MTRQKESNHIRVDKETTRQHKDRSETTLVKTGGKLRGSHARCKVTPDQRNTRVHRGEEQEQEKEREQEQHEQN
jgi:hypothetical protein